MTADEIIEGLRKLAQTQFPESELDQAKFLVSLLETKLREQDYRAEQARDMLRRTMNGEGN